MSEAFVVDTSVTMAWCFEDEASEETDRLLETVAQHGCLVPALWSAEVANVLLVAQRKGRVSPAQRDRFLALLDRLPVTVEVATPDISALVWLADKYTLSSYDAWYLWLAIRTGASIATADQRLRAAAREAGVRNLL